MANEKKVDFRNNRRKLSYVNKLFSLGLGYNQERKQEIIRQFDLTQEIEEVKLLYYTYRMELYRDINARFNE